MNKKHVLYWRLCCAGMILLSVLAFTPLFIPPGKFQPSLGSVPYTMWSGFLLTVALVFLTYLGTRVHPGKQTDPHI